MPISNYYTALVGVEIKIVELYIKYVNQISKLYKSRLLCTLQPTL